MVCIICYQSLFEVQEGVEDGNNRAANPPAALQCGHTFHKECIATWFAQSASTRCPVCQEQHAGQVTALFIDIDDGELAALHQRRNRQARAGPAANNNAARDEADAIMELLERLGFGVNDEIADSTIEAVTRMVVERNGLMERLDEQERQIRELTERDNQAEVVAGNLRAQIQRVEILAGRNERNAEESAAIAALLRREKARTEELLEMAELRVTELEMSLGRYDLLSIAHKVHIKALEKKATSARARLAAANGAIAALTSDVDQLRVTSDDYTEIVNTLQNALDIAMATAV